MLSCVRWQHLFIQFGKATKKKMESILCKCSWPSGMCSNAKQSGRGGGALADEIEMRERKSKTKYLTCNLNKNTICKEKCVLNSAKMLEKNANFLHYVNSSLIFQERLTKFSQMIKTLISES